MSDKIYNIELIGGPLDGVDLTWMWNNDEHGRKGEASGMIIMDGVGYQCNEDRTKAYHVMGQASPELMSFFQGD